MRILVVGSGGREHALGAGVQDARAAAYAAAKAISFEGMQLRTDIAANAEVADGAALSGLGASSA
jgi:phosphoribosylamine-glycine ligase